MSKLILFSGTNKETEFELGDRRKLVVGRDPACHVILTGRTISRRHAVIEMKDDGIYVADTNSYNGTFVNSRRVTQPVKLADGDEIRVANRTLRYFAESRAMTPQPAASAAAAQSGKSAAKDEEDSAQTDPAFNTGEAGGGRGIDAFAGDVLGSEFDITPDLVAQAGVDEQEQRLSQIRRMVLSDSIGQDPLRFLEAMKEYVAGNVQDPEICVLLEAYAGTRPSPERSDAEDYRIRAILLEIERKSPSWADPKRLKELKQALEL